MTVVLVRCTRLSAATVDRKPRFHSSQPRVVQSIVRNAIRSIDQSAGTRYNCVHIGKSRLFGFPMVFLLNFK